jgi:hypothetical protein
MFNHYMLMMVLALVSMPHPHSTLLKPPPLRMKQFSRWPLNEARLIADGVIVVFFAVSLSLSMANSPADIVDGLTPSMEVRIPPCSFDPNFPHHYQNKRTRTPAENHSSQLSITMFDFVSNVKL